ncbi:hypothetical protein MJH12_14535 [bacterium]|nr:hypothetical protein [bacterium]
MKLLKRFPGSKIQYVDYLTSEGEKLQDTEIRVSCEVVLGVENEDETRMSVEVSSIDGNSLTGIIRSFSNCPFLDSWELGDTISFEDEHIFICKSGK